MRRIAVANSVRGLRERIASRTPSRRLSILAAVLVLGLVGALLYVFWPSPAMVSATAYFTRTVGIYPGSDVRILGVRVGSVTAVKPEGGQVRVDFQYGAGYKVPANAQAAIITASVVSDRYLQLLPVYRGGAVMATGAVIPLSRTAVPVELDDTLSSLNNLSVALGPQGANSDGSLSRLLGVTADNLNGEGAKLHQTVQDLSQAASTLSDNKQNLFGTVSNLQNFTAKLAADDQQVRSFESNLADVSAQLAAERQDLAAALKNLASALGDVSAFVHDNKAEITSDVKGLNDIAGILVKEQAALAEFLSVAPDALGNLANAYNPTAGTLDTRMNVQQTQDPALFLCSLLDSFGQQIDCSGLQKLFSTLPKLPSADPLTGALTGTLDKTLGGLLGGQQ
jgi:phospholipid/cholesterol/gamma-HCH transport system substrate-binding protein